MKEKLLETSGLTKEFTLNDSFIDRLFGATETLSAVNNVDIGIYEGEVLGLVGESGSGKSTLARTILQLYKPTSGSVLFDGVDLTDISEKEMKKYRRKMAMVFQDPGSSLNRRKTAAQIIKQPMQVHGLHKGERDERVEELMEAVGLPPHRSNQYPHEFSGGQQQRIGIARALSVNPEFLIADEPVSALDVSVQAQILNLLKDLKSEYNLTILFIAHDLSVIKHICDRVAVMYLGEIVEIAETDKLFSDFRHPYTQSLLKAIPEPIPQSKRKHEAISGEIPSPLNPPTGCSFHTRCPAAIEECSRNDPILEQVDQSGHMASCIRLNDWEPDHSILGEEEDYGELQYPVDEFNLQSNNK